MLDLAGNSLTHTQRTGPPVQSVAKLDYNALVGAIPPELGQLTNLSRLPRLTDAELATCRLLQQPVEFWATCPAGDRLDQPVTIPTELGNLSDRGWGR